MINAKDYPTFAAAFRAALLAYRAIEHKPDACVTIVGVSFTPTGTITLKRA